jgi:uncharacterized protein YcfL
MKIKVVWAIAAIFAGHVLIACDSGSKTGTNSAAALREFKQEIVVRTPVKQIRLGQKVMLAVTIKNPGIDIWRAFSERPVRLSYHWMDQKGKIVIYDGERTILPRDINPGEAVELQAVVKSPDQKGVYILHLTLVQEQVAWFDDKGGEAVDIQVSIKL